MKLHAVYSFSRPLILGLHASGYQHTFLTFQLDEDTESIWWEDLMPVIYSLFAVHVQTPVSTLEHGGFIFYFFYFLFLSVGCVAVKLLNPDLFVCGELVTVC